MRFPVLLMAASLLLGCASSGPRTQDILENTQAVKAAHDQETPFAIVSINTQSAKQASAWLNRAQQQAFINDTGDSPVIIGPSDILEISIVSTSESGYIDMTNSTLSPISTSTLPLQEVGSDGMVSVPPIGRVQAKGRTAEGFEQYLERRLGEVLVDPSVIVRIVERRSARVSVLGAVVSPGTYSIEQNRKYLVEVLAQAGGPQGRSEDLDVVYSRGEQTGRAKLNSVYENPRYNIHVRHGDVISVEQPARRLTVLGAGGQNTTITYDQPDLNLVEALGLAQGLMNCRADRKGVFIYRELPPEAAADLGVEVASFDGRVVPTIFNVDMSAPQSLFAAKNFEMGEKDLIYISDSLHEEISAIFAIFGYFSPVPAEFIRDVTID